MAGRSLFHRLRAAADPASRPFAEGPEDLRNSIRANLQNLFNTWMGHAPAQMDLGLPSPSEIAYRYPDSIPEVRRAIENNIAKYEPRLENVRVFHVESEGESLQIGYQIEAVTKDGETFSFETLVDHSGEVNLVG
ncbi:MAG: type VI secretion system baseplate subunit TssE [Planctomycetota bacterium]|jgi:type VI secretion system lysozyme-like protein